MTKDPKKVAAGRKGGQTTARRYGKEYYSLIGKMGAEAFHTKYRLVPVELTRFAIVRRSDGKFINYLDGQPIPRRPYPDPPEF